MWFWHHRYLGIRHDSVLYAVQALHKLYPANYAQDIFFSSGSQDEFTLFSPLFAKLIQLFGLGEAALLLTMLGAILWLWGVFRVSSLWSGWARWIFLGLVVTIPIAYGGRDVFHAGEAFAVPRIWAEALTMLGVASWVKKQWLWAAMALITAALLHPLMALAGFMFCYFYAFQLNRIWIASSLGLLLAVCLLALLKISLFGRLFQTMDPVWFDLVYQRTSYYMFPTAWSMQDYNMLIWNSVVISLVIVRNDAIVMRRLMLAVLASGLVAMVVTVLGADWLHSVLLLQIQAWRVLWLVYVVGLGAFAWLCVEFWSDKNLRFVILGLIAAWIMRESSGGFLAVMSAFGYFYHHHLSTRIRHLVAGLFIFAILLGGVWAGMDAWTVYSLYKPGDVSALYVLLMRIQAFNELIPLLSWGILLVGVMLVQRAVEGGHKLIVWFAVAVVLLFCFSRWDVRSDQLKLLESGALWGKTPFDSIIPIHATVYWHDGVDGTWFLLGRASYFSIKQAAGIVFSRENAIGTYNRFEQVKSLGGADGVFKLLSRTQAFWRIFTHDYVEPGTRRGLMNTCRNSKADYVILDKRYADLSMATWKAPMFGEVYLYSCQMVKQHEDMQAR